MGDMDSDGLLHWFIILKDQNTASMRVIILLSMLSLLGHCIYPGNQITFSFVTALWRPSSQEDQGPLPYSQQLQLLDTLLKTGQNVIIFGDEELIQHVMQYRFTKNTVFVIMTLDELKKNRAAVQVQDYLPKLRKENPQLYNKYQNQPQFRSSEYASILFSKPFLLEKALSYNTFEAEYLYWIEPDILHNQEYPESHEDKGELTFGRERNLLRKLSMHFQMPFIVRSGNASIAQQGLKDSLNVYGNISSIAMTEWFGGRVQAIPTAVALYEDLLRVILVRGDYWSHEGLFTLMIHRYPKVITEVNHLSIKGMYYFDINGFINRPIRQIRHLNLAEGSNSTLRMTAITQTPAPVFTTVTKTYENYFEYEVLIKHFKFRADRERIFLACLIMVYLLVRILKRETPQKSKTAVR